MTLLKEFLKIIYSYFHKGFQAARYAGPVCFVYPRLILNNKVDHFAAESV